MFIILIRMWYGRSARVLIQRYKNLAIIASLYYDENLKRLFEEKYTTEYDFIKKQASANEIVRQTKNTQPLNNCNIILFDADGNIYGTVADGLDISWLEEKPYFPS